ncbi:hypothetical protein C3486_20955 [Streptomyces sp. Ru73]|nr:hypothetical protein C3486_20955 [Streptomyces sp. Ru73]
MFIDNSGWRRRLSRVLAVTVGCACAGYLMLVGVLVGGLWQPVGSQPPSTKGPLPAAGKPSPHTGRPVAGQHGPRPGRPVVDKPRPAPSSRAEAGAPRGGAER